jgi:hypothetical protein
MGAWWCEGEGCGATIPGAHPIEQGDEGWDRQDPMLCRACTAELALQIVEQWVEHRLDGKGGGLQSARTELTLLQAALKGARADVDRAETFNPSA